MMSVLIEKGWGRKGVAGGGSKDWKREKGGSGKEWSSPFYDLIDS